MTQRGPSRGDLNFIWQRRWKARTDLEWLCKNVLDYTLIDHDVHGPMIAHLQQFPLPSREEARSKDKILDNGTFEYVPGDPYVELPGGRRRILFFSRGYFKTTVNTIAHTVQWFLNYPHFAMALLFSTDKKAQDILASVKHHFQFNPKLRELFPEYCPKTRVADWGNAESFSLINSDFIRERKGLPPRVEPSVMSQSLEKSQAGYHFDGIKCSDIVEENNVQTQQQRDNVFKRFGLLPKMLVKRPDGRDGWLDLEGTLYHPDDLHSRMIEFWLAEHEKGESHGWQIFINGVFKRDTKGMPPKYDPWEMKYCQFLLDANGKRCPTWPTADPIEKLEREEVDPVEGFFTFATQRILDISADKSGNRPFDGPLTYITRADFAKVPIVRRRVSVDLADTTGVRANHSVIVTAAYDRMGRCYIEHIDRGKWGPDETISRIFKTAIKYQPDKVVIEETGYVKGLKPSIDRTSHMTGYYPIWDFITADRTKSKVNRIVNALQTPFRGGATGSDLRFVTPFDVSDDKNNKDLQLALEAEFSQCTLFSTGKTDDILDAIAYQFLSRDWSGIENLGGNSPVQTNDAIGRLIDQQYNQKISEIEYQKAFKRMIWEPAQVTVVNDPFRERTGW